MRQVTKFDKTFYRKGYYRQDRYPYKSKYGNIKPKRLSNYEVLPWYDFMRKHYNRHGASIVHNAKTSFSKAVLDSIIDLMYNSHTPSFRRQLIYSVAKTIGHQEIGRTKRKYLSKYPNRHVRNVETYLHKLFSRMKSATPDEFHILVKNAKRDINEIREGTYLRNLYRRRFKYS